MPCHRGPRKSLGGKTRRGPLPSKAARKEAELSEKEVDKPELASAESEIIDGVSIHEEDSSAEPVTKSSQSKALVKASTTDEKSKMKPVPKSAESKTTKKVLGANKDKPKPKPKPTHPKTSDMIIEAIKSLKNRKGSTLQAIKNYMASEYSVDPKKLAYLIRKYVLEAVKSGELIQLNGIGLQGRFKLSKELSKKAGSVEEKPAKTAKNPASKKKTNMVSTTKKREPVDKAKSEKPKTVAKPRSSKKK